MGSFSTEKDFEHGEWIDGEFFASRNFDQEPKRKRTKEDNLYGIFADGGDSSEEDRPGKGKGKGRGKKDSALRAAPAFVSSTVQAPSTKEAQSSAPAVSGPAAKNGLDNAAFSSMIGRAEEKEKMAVPAAKPSGGIRVAQSEKVDKDFATFEQHTKGFGAKMMAKMGWAKGQALGPSDQQGILNPIESQLRPATLGLGYGGFKETTTKAKAQQRRILHNSDSLNEVASHMGLQPLTHGVAASSTHGGSL